METFSENDLDVDLFALRRLKSGTLRVKYQKDRSSEQQVYLSDTVDMVGIESDNAVYWSNDQKYPNQSPLIEISSKY